MIPQRPLLIHLEDMVLTFEFGWSFWLVLAAGSLCLIIGISISVIDLVKNLLLILEHMQLLDQGCPLL